MTTRNKRPRVYNPATKTTDDFLMPAHGIDFIDQETLPEKMAAIEKDVEDLKKVAGTSTSTTVASAALPQQLGYAVYTGYAQAPILKYDSSLVSLGGALSGTNVKTYTGTATLLKGKWTDNNTSTTRNFQWSIKPMKVPIPHVARTYVAGSDTKTLELVGLLNGMTVGGVKQAKDAGEYVATVMLEDTSNYEWLDTTDRTVDIPWRILPQNIASGSGGNSGGSGSTSLDTEIADIGNDIDSIETDIENIWDAIEKIQKTAIFTTQN